MARHLTTLNEPPIEEQVKQAILACIPAAEVAVAGNGGHFQISVISSAFEGKNRVQCQRLVLGSIKHLMGGDGAPVHAIDSLVTRVP